VCASLTHTLQGTLSPLAGVGLCVSIQFAAVEQLKAGFAARNKPGDSLSWTQHFLCGAGAGVANSIVSGPVEHIRSRLQVQAGPKGTAAAYNGTVDAFRKISAAHGIAGIYKGQTITVLR
jgi:solute carrier family 25 (mitochondrial carnitine/acylcarnitine transporter), member 20/29